VSSEADLLAAICAAPDDDGPRLVYADWLIEHDQAARGELIAVQCELARLAEDDPRATRLRERERAIMSDPDSAAFVDPFRAVVHDPRASVTFTRGMVEHLTVRSIGHLARAADRIFAIAPIRSITVGPTGSGSELVALCAMPQLARVERLQLARLFIDDHGAELLAGAGPRVARLQQLVLADNRIGPPGAAALAQSPWLAPLRGLDLSSNPIGVRGAQAISASASLAKLAALDLFACALGAEGTAALVAGTKLVSLRSLRLAGNDLGDEGAAAISIWPRLAELVRLDLSANGIGDPGANALAASRFAARLEMLDLRGNVITGEGAGELARSPHFTALRQLGLLAKNRIVSRMSVSKGMIRKKRMIPVKVREMHSMFHFRDGVEIV
jgi:uncharacterized protein (TIGR02996 family)